MIVGFGMGRKACLLMAWIAAVLVATPAPAGAQTVSTRYQLSILGLSIGQADFQTTIEGGRYSVSGTMRSSGIARLFSDSQGTSSVRGRTDDAAFRPERYALDYTADDKRWSSEVLYSGRSVRSAKVAPSRDDDDKGYVPLTRAQVRDAIDPLSGLLIPAGEPGAVCGRTVPMYDGWSRMDVVLSDAGSKPFAMQGYSGRAAVCDVRLKPVGGYDADSDGLKYLTQRTITVAFAPIGRAGLYVPVEAEIPTKVGTLSMAAISVTKR